MWACTLYPDHMDYDMVKNSLLLSYGRKPVTATITANALSDSMLAILFNVHSNLIITKNKLRL